jgi:hypothetical protein
MPADEIAPFEAELAADPELAAALAEYREALGLSAALAPVQAPANFERKVRQTMRRRSRGRLFAPESAHREAQMTQLFIVFALLLLVYIAFNLGLHRLEELVDDGRAPVEGSATPTDEAPPAPQTITDDADGSAADLEGIPTPSWQMAREGTDGTTPILAMRHEIVQYSVDSPLDGEALAADLFIRFGGARVRRDGDTFYVTVAPDEFVGMAERLPGVGPVAIERLTVDAPPPNHVFVIRARHSALATP